jgi:hypothetical protein
MSRYTGQSDDKLAEIAEMGGMSHGAEIEAMHRLRIAIEASSAKTDIYSRRRSWLIVILILLILVEAVVAADVIKRWFFQR